MSTKNIVFDQLNGTYGVVRVDEGEQSGPYLAHLISIGILPPDVKVIGFDMPESEVSKLIAKKTIEEVRSQLDSRVSELIESTAKSLGYDSMISAASYVTSTIPQYKKEAKALVAWRDSVWTAWYATRTSSDESELMTALDELPKFLS